MKIQRLLANVVIVAAAILVYRTTLSAYFFDDDLEWLVGSWSFGVARLVAFDSMTHFYRPVIDLYFALATPLFNGSPTLFHAANVALHAANGLVVFAVARTISRSALYGFAAALVFVVQPGNIEAVAWIGALAEPLGAFLAV